MLSPASPPLPTGHLATPACPSFPHGPVGCTVGVANEARQGNRASADSPSVPLLLLLRELGGKLDATFRKFTRENLKMWYVYIMEYYPAIEKNKIMPFAGTWMQLEIILLSEVSQTEKDKYHMISLICGI